MNYSVSDKWLPGKLVPSKLNIVLKCAGRNVNYMYVLFYLLAYTIDIMGQPSGGPYGPIPKHYELPRIEGEIYYVSPDGKEEYSGQSTDQPTSLESAIKQVSSGDAIILRGGVYRTGNLVLNQGITIQPYADEQVILKGTLLATEWEGLKNGLWRTNWSHLFPSLPDDWWRRDREGKKTPLHRFNNDMVFIDGQFMQSAGWEGDIDENSFYIDYEEEKIYIGIDPTNHEIEITAFDVALHRVTKEVHGKASDKKGPVIRGITFMQYAYRALEFEGTDPDGISPETDHGKEIVGTTLEDCTISFCSRVAAYLRGDNLIIRRCKVSDTSTEGIYILSSSDVLLEKNIFTRNNIENITGYFPAAVKIFNQSYRVICRDNLVIDHPNSNGIWYDVGNVDGVFVNNWIENVGYIDPKTRTDQKWPSRSGFFFEISKGAICAGNVFINCDHGVFILNSSDVSIYNNTFVNSIVNIKRDGRVEEGDHFGWHPSTGPGIDQRYGHVFVNNLLVAEAGFVRPLLLVRQPAELCDLLNNSQLKQIDHNVYVHVPNKDNQALISWSPVSNDLCRLQLESPGDLKKLHPEFSTDSKYYHLSDIPLFKSIEIGNYQLLESFPGLSVATDLPEIIKEVLEINKKTAGYIGAYFMTP